MGYVLLWVEGLVVALLCLALVAGWAVARPSFLRVAGIIVVFLLFFGMAALAAFATGAQREFNSPELFVYTLSWLLGYVVASVLLLRRAVHRSAPGLVRTGAGWPRKQLWLSLGGAILAFGLTFWNLDLAVRADLALARQEASDLLLTMTPPAVADSENPAHLYIEAGKDLIRPIPDPWYDAARKDNSTDPRGEVNWKAPSIVEHIAKQEKVLSLLRKAAAMPPCTLDGRRSLEEFGEAWQLERLRSDEMILLAIDARVKAAQGNPARALEDVAAILGMSRHVPTFLSAPRIIGTPALAWQTLEDVLRLTPARKDPLPAVSFPEIIPPLRAVHQERAVMAMIWPTMLDNPLRIRQIRENGSEWFKPPLVYLIDSLVLPACRVFLMPAELRSSHQKWDQYRRILESPGCTPQDWAELQKAIETDSTGILSTIFMKPKERKLFKDAGEAAALGELARTALAATRYREKHGKYPERLEQLVPAFLPAMPVDPRDGQVLRLKHFPKVVVLYTAQSSPKLESERSWNPEKHKNEVLFRLYPGGK